MSMIQHSKDEQTTDTVDILPEQYSPACREIQLIDECLIYEDDERLREIDHLFDELTL